MRKEAYEYVSTVLMVKSVFYELYIRMGVVMTFALLTHSVIHSFGKLAYD